MKYVFFYILFFTTFLCNTIHSQDKKSQIGINMNLLYSVSKYFESKSIGCGLVVNFDHLFLSNASIGGEIGYYSKSFVPVIINTKIYLTNNKNFQPYFFSGFGLCFAKYTVFVFDAGNFINTHDTKSLFTIKLCLGASKNIYRQIYSTFSVDYMTLYSKGKMVVDKNFKTEIPSNTSYIGFTIGVKY